MSTLIDSLVIELGLDPSKFKEGQKDVEHVSDEFKRKLKKDSEEVEAKAGKMQDALYKVRNQLLAFFAVFTAGKGLDAFIQDTVRAETALGRFSELLGMGIGTLAGWRSAALLTGGSADSVQQSIASLTSDAQKFALTGQSAVLPYMRALGLQFHYNKDGVVDMNQTLLDLSGVLSRMPTQKAMAWGQMMGISPDLIFLLHQGPAAIKAYQNALAPYTRIMAEGAPAAMALTKSWNLLSIASSALGERILTTLAPALIKLLTGLQHLVDWGVAHPEAVLRIFWALGAAVLGLTVALLAFAAPAILAAAAIGAVVYAVLALGDALQGTALLKDFSSALDDIMTILSTPRDSAKAKAAWHDLGVQLGRAFRDGFLELAKGVAEAGYGIAAFLHGDEVTDKERAEFDARWNKMLGEGPPGPAPKAPARGEAPRTGGLTLDDVAALERTAAYAKAHGIPEDQVVSPAGAIGRHQVMPSTAAGYGYSRGWLFDPATNAKVAQLLLNDLNKRYPNDPEAAAIAYNAGPKVADRWLASGRNPNVLPPETRDYAARFETRAATRTSAKTAPAHPTQTPPPVSHARIPFSLGGAGLAQVSNYDNSRAQSSHSEVHINTLTVQTQATDAPGIAQGLKEALERNAFAFNSNYGHN